MNTETNTPSTSASATESNTPTGTGGTGTLGTPATLSATAATAGALTGKAAALAKLSEFDIILLIDASGSMGDPNKAGVPTPTRWDYMQETAITFTRDACSIDADGIGVVVFSGTGITIQDNCTVDAVRQIFKDRTPRGTTPLAEGLQRCLQLGQGSNKKKIIAVFTDGSPDNQDAAATVIRNQSNSQANDDDLTFVFVQVGDDAGATAYLNKLDNELTGTKFDIVSAYTIEEADKFASTAELLVHAIDN